MNLGQGAVLMDAITTTWTGKPAASSVPVGTKIRISDLSYKEFFSNGTRWVPAGGSVLLGHGVGTDLTGTLVATALASVTVPGGLLGTTGGLRVNALWSYNNNANVKSLIHRLAGVTVLSNGRTTSVKDYQMLHIANTASDAQVHTNVPLPIQSNTTAVGTTAIDTSVDMVYEFVGQLANTGDNVKLEMYSLEAFSL